MLFGAPVMRASVLLGNIPGVRDPTDPPSLNTKLPNFPQESTSRIAIPKGRRHRTSSPSDVITPPTVPVEPIPSTAVLELGPQVNAVQTRSTTMKRVHPLVVPALQPLSITPTDFGNLQASCRTLAGLREKANANELETTRDGSTFQYTWTNGLLYRRCISSNHQEKVSKDTLVVPKDCRQIILSVGHENPLAGYFSHRIKFRSSFFWSGMGATIKFYWRSYNKCHWFSGNGRVQIVPFQPLI